LIIGCQVVEQICEAVGLPTPVKEYRFHPQRRWRFDYAWPEHRIAIEIEGGAWIYGRHTRAKGFVNDMEKYNAAVLLGWRVLRYTPEQIKAGKWVDNLAKLLYSQGHEHEPDDKQADSKARCRIQEMG
jgi:very-short-patch-repair endonuclease